MAVNLENFVSIRKLYPRVSERPGHPQRLEVSDPGNATERDYRDLLSEANLNFFHREYGIALQNYLELRHKILQQSHPEMPRVPGIGHLIDFAWYKVEAKNIVELSRRVVAAKPMDGPVIHYTLTDERLIKAGEMRANPVFERWSKVGVELKEAGKSAGLLGNVRAAAVSAPSATAVTTAMATRVGLFSPAGTQSLSLAADSFSTDLLEAVYKPRITATTLERLDFFEVVEVNFVAYYVHLYFFVLPIAIGDCYVAMGQYDRGLAEYRGVLSYTYLNLGIEARMLWQKMADAQLQAGNALYRRGLKGQAKARYEALLLADRTVPNSELYQGKFGALRAEVQEIVKQLAGQPHAATNPRVAAVITQAAMRLDYLSQGFNFYGIGLDDAPVLRFKYVQSVATYMADSAIEAERTFVSYRSTAENQKMDHMQLQSAVDVNQAALAIENKKLEDAALEIEAARRTREYAELRQSNADDALNEWDTSGRELTSMNDALSWAGQAANDQEIRYIGVQYDGAHHDYEGTVEEFFDTVGRRREWLDWEMQRNRIERQRAEAAAEVAMTQAREQQALVRYQVQQLGVVLAQVRLQGAQEMLDYADSRMFDEDLWFQLAAQMQDLARDHLDSAIYAALVMERAYELEFDRRLNRIRTDYALAGPAGLLGGDHLKRDIISFTSDYLLNAQKQNPVRLAISLREEYPSGFASFIETGLLPFRTDLEIFDRRYPGTYRRKIKRIEIFVEGLVPLEGASGFLTNNGVCSEWRFIAGAWVKHVRVMPVERMVLSSYQFRRDIAVFQPSEELLALFENYAPQCEWTLELPRSGNNLDYQAISDIKFVVYFDADHSDLLATHVKGFYPASGGRSTVLSARFQYPDEYFRFDAERSVDFAVTSAFFAYNHVDPALSAFGVRLVAAQGASVANVALLITRASDGSTVTATTNANGVVTADPTTMAPFAAWLNASAIDTWRVGLTDGTPAAAVADIQLIYSYAFAYRADGSLA